MTSIFIGVWSKPPVLRPLGSLWLTKVAGSCLRLQLLQVLREKRRDIFEPGDVSRMNLHERLVRFEAGAGDFLAAGVAGREVLRLGFFQLDLALGHLEQVQHTEAFKQLGDARVGIEQLNRSLAVAAGARRGDLQTKTGEHTEKGAVHQRAVRQVE